MSVSAAVDTGGAAANQSARGLNVGTCVRALAFEVHMYKSI